MREQNGSLKSVICHWDGYLSHVGRMLLTYYNTDEKANALIALGYLDILEKYLYPLPASLKRYFDLERNPKLISTHSYDSPQKDVTIAYHRDTNQEFEQNTYSSLKDFEQDKPFIELYSYLFKDGQWHVMSSEVKDDEWVVLTPEMVKLPKEVEDRLKTNDERENKVLKAIGTIKALELPAPEDNE